jgi:hypothetical protein
MIRNTLFVLLLATGVVLADDAPAAGRAAPASGTQAKKEDAPGKKEDAPKTLDGMSILGNQEAPKSLVIVPWKSSELGGSPGVSTLLDSSRLPVDKDVFLRALGYYEIRSGRP